MEPTIQGYRYSIERHGGCYVIQGANGHFLTDQGKWIGGRWYYESPTTAQLFAARYHDKPKRSAEEQAKLLEEAGW